MHINCPPSNPPLLKVQELSLSFPNQEHAVDRVSFELAAGKTLGLVGASGAGKSSIARTILRLAEPYAGKILFNGKSIFSMNREQLKEARQRIQIVFQEPSASLSPRRTVAQTLLEPLRHFAIGDANYRQDKIRQTLQTVGLNHDALQRYPNQFSSGQQQRIAIARALVTNPELLIADEAVSALDVSVQAQILQLIQSLQKDHGIAFLFISHDLAVIRQIADEVAVMYRGQLLEHSPADMFFSRPAHPYSKALLAFARFESSARLRTDQLPASQGPGEHSSACIYAGLCVDRMPVCERLEPEYHKIQHTEEPHCVKCHLYDEVHADDKLADDN
ncbi:MAG: ABC transporter ATP-binding protein [Gammaproteobacteria bacterium]|nr:MAG: ABC transporter ATP-binding protein [Gammaproteobacteria bacterium]